jgi:hypothetical protein
MEHGLNAVTSRIDFFVVHTPSPTKFSLYRNQLTHINAERRFPRQFSKRQHQYAGQSDTAIPAAYADTAVMPF